MHKPSFHSLIALCLLLLSACLLQAQDRVSLTHMNGESSFPSNPKRIVVYDYAMLDNIMSLGIDAEIALPKTLLPAYLDRYKDARYLDLGAIREVNLETLNAYKPDAIFISGRQASYYDELVKIAPVFVSNPVQADRIATIKHNIQSIGKLYNKQEAAEKHIARIDAAIAQTRQKAQQSGKKALFVLTNDGKVSLFGAGSRFGFLFDSLGIIQAGQEVEASTHGQQTNYEYITISNPDIIYVLDRSLAIGREPSNNTLSQNPLVKRTNAAQHNAIILLDPQVWYLVGGGITATLQMINEVSAAL